MEGKGSRRVRKPPLLAFGTFQGLHTKVLCVETIYTVSESMCIGRPGICVA